MTSNSHINCRCHKMTYHESAHSLLLDAFLFLLLFALGVRMPHHDGLVALADLEWHAAVEVLEVLSVLQHRIQVFLQSKKRYTWSEFVRLSLTYLTDFQIQSNILYNFAIRLRQLFFLANLFFLSQIGERSLIFYTNLIVLATSELTSG